MDDTVLYYIYIDNQEISVSTSKVWQKEFIDSEFLSGHLEVLMSHLEVLLG
jgi:hypothetical protein